MSLSKWLPCDFEQCHPLLWGGGILVDHWSTISSCIFIQGIPVSGRMDLILKQGHNVYVTGDFPHYLYSSSRGGGGGGGGNAVSCPNPTGQVIIRSSLQGAILGWSNRYLHSAEPHWKLMKVVESWHIFILPSSNTMQLSAIITVKIL